MSERYSFDSLLKIVRNPELVPRAIATLSLDINRKWYHLRYGQHGEDFFSKEWDNLLILDAARPDILRDIKHSDGITVEETFSTASYSLEFIQTQFIGNEFHDTVYITANPYTSEIPDGTFYKVINLLEDSWDNQLKTVPPEAVLSKTIQEFESHQNKRFIIHFMQPHYPFIGPSGDEISAGISDTAETTSGTNPWNEKMWGKDVNRDILLEAYRENHEIAMKYALKLVGELPGKTVITADHANLVGERGFPIPIRLYGHPKIAHPKVKKVPWIKFDGRDRDTIEEEPIKRSQMDDETVLRRLESLGYT